MWKIKDLSHYYGATPGVDIEKATNGFDADLPTGPAITPDGEVTWSYQVVNTGNTSLANVTVIDSEGLTVACADHYSDTDGDDVIDLMLPGDDVTCTATGTATAGQYENTGSVSGDPVLPDAATCGCDLTDPTTWPTALAENQPVVDPADDPWVASEDNDDSHYYGADPVVNIEKSTKHV